MMSGDPTRTPAARRSLLWINVAIGFAVVAGGPLVYHAAMPRVAALRPLTLRPETPEQAAARMRQEVPKGLVVEITGRFVTASEMPEPTQRQLTDNLAVIQRRCAVLVGRGDLSHGPAIGLYYPETQAELSSLYRRVMGKDLAAMHGCLTFNPMRARGSADVGNGTLAHELVHAFVMSDWPRVPGWLNESLAVAIGCPKIALRTSSGAAIDDLWLHVGREALALNRWTPVAVTFGCAGSDYDSLDTVDLEIAGVGTIGVGPLLTGRLLIRMLDETGRLDRFYQGWRDRGGVGGALEAIGLPNANTLDHELRGWIAAEKVSGNFLGREKRS
jgi:hypothetical protein